MEYGRHESAADRGLVSNGGAFGGQHLADLEILGTHSLLFDRSRLYPPSLFGNRLDAISKRFWKYLRVLCTTSNVLVY